LLLRLLLTFLQCLRQLPRALAHSWFTLMKMWLRTSTAPCQHVCSTGQCGVQVTMSETHGAMVQPLLPLLLAWAFMQLHYCSMMPP